MAPAYHPLTHLSGVLIGVVWVTLVVLAIHAARALRAHLRSEAATRLRGRGGSIAVVLLGQSLATLLRLSVLVCAVVAAIGQVWALMATWLQIDERDQDMRDVAWYRDPVQEYSSGRFSPTANFCIACAKLGPPLYVFSKGFTYRKPTNLRRATSSSLLRREQRASHCKLLIECIIFFSVCAVFFFLKMRTVRPTEKLSRLHRLILFGTVGVFPWGVGTMVTIQGARSELDGSCIFRVPVWGLLAMMAADWTLSAMFLYMFVAPLRALVTANKHTNARRREGKSAMVVTVTQPPPAPSTFLAAHTTAATSPRSSLASPAPTTTVALASPSHKDARSGVGRDRELRVSIASAAAATTLTVSPSATSPSATCRSPDPDPTSPPLMPQPTPLTPTALSPTQAQAQGRPVHVHSRRGWLGPGASSSEASVAVARGQALEAVMRRNTRSCLFSVGCTTLSLGWMTAAHLLDDPHLMRLVWPIGVLDIGATCLAIYFLMHSSSSSSSSSSSNNNNGNSEPGDRNHGGAAAVTHVSSRHGALSSSGGGGGSGRALPGAVMQMLISSNHNHSHAPSGVRVPPPRVRFNSGDSDCDDDNGDDHGVGGAVDCGMDLDRGRGMEHNVMAATHSRARLSGLYPGGATGPPPPLPAHHPYLQHHHHQHHPSPELLQPQAASPASPAARSFRLSPPPTRASWRAAQKRISRSRARRSSASTNGHDDNNDNNNDVDNDREGSVTAGTEAGALLQLLRAGNSNSSDHGAGAPALTGSSIELASSTTSSAPPPLPLLPMGSESAVLHQSAQPQATHATIASSENSNRPANSLEEEEEERPPRAAASPHAMLMDGKLESADTFSADQL